MWHAYRDALEDFAAARGGRGAILHAAASTFTCFTRHVRA
jgi:hypothetical protein